MAVQRTAFFAAAICLMCLARHPQRASGFAPNALAGSSATTNSRRSSDANHRDHRDHHHHRRSSKSTSVVLLRATEPTATEKAAELRRRAEEAKRKAEELKKVAEQKAAAVMVAMKNASDRQSAEQASAAASPRKPVTPPAPPKATEASGTASPPRDKASARAADDARGGAIIPVNRENVEFASGVLAGGFALALGASPVLAVVAAAAVNYVSKKDDLGELHELVQALSKASLNTFNWIAKLDSKYSILGKLTESLDKSIGELKNSDGESAETFKSIEETVSKTTKQIQKLADEIDLLEGGKQALGAVGEVLETSIDKAVDANKEYKLTERAAEAAKKAVERAKEMNK
jgi:hypothetical protein